MKIIYEMSFPPIDSLYWEFIDRTMGINIYDLASVKIEIQQQFIADMKGWGINEKEK